MVIGRTSGFTTNIPAFVNKPLTHITPMSLTDGVTFERKLDWLYNYVINSLVPELDGILDGWFEQYKKDHEELLQNITNVKNEWKELFDQFMADVVNQLEGLNDQAAANLVRNNASKLREALNENFLQVSGAYELYVNPVTGSDTNTGTETAPFKTVKRAVDVALLKTVLPNMECTIHLAPGTYGERIVFPDTTPFNYRLHFKGADVGGHPNNPITVFTEGDNAAAVAFVNRNVAAYIVFEDIAFNGYKGSASAGGITNVNGTFRVINCHFNYCTYGVTSFHGNLEMPNGKVSNCTAAGIRSMMHNRHVIGIQNAGERSRTTIFENNSTGFLAQENSTGHADYCNFYGNSRAIEANISSRVNATGSLFDGNTVGVYLAFSSNTYLTSSCVFTNNNTDTIALSGSTVLAGGRVFDGGAGTSTAKERASFGGSYSTKEISSTSATEIFRQDVFKQWFKEAFKISGTPVKEVRSYTVFRLDGTAGKKFLNIRHLGGNQQIEFAATDVGVRTLETVVKFVNATKQIVHSVVIGNFVESRVYVTERATDMSGDGTVSLLLQGSVENTADKITVYYTEQDGIY